MLRRSSHFQTLFRVLRPDECLTKRLIKPVAPIQSSPRTLREKVCEHVTDGSSPNYKSSLISCTSELNVALSFGGILSRIAVIDPRDIHETKIEYLDREYLRQARLTDKHTISRSKRSDEVVVDTNIRFDHFLNVKVVDCERTLSWFRKRGC